MISLAVAVTQKLRPSLRSAAEPPAEGCVEEGGPDAVPQVLVVVKSATGHDDLGGVSLASVDVRPGVILVGVRSVFGSDWNRRERR